MTVFKDEKILINIEGKNNNALNIALCFPNIYKIGIASLGYQTAWRELNQNKNVRTIRWFTDIKENFYNGENLSYIGFSFSWELDYKNIFKVLEENNIPILKKERTDNDPLIFSGGQIPNANPEPFIDNFDFFLLGDLEEVSKPFLEKLIEIKDLPRNKKLLELGKLDGIYVPEENIFNPIKVLKTKNKLSYSSIITPHSFWSDVFLLEVVRSCPELCRFCLASYGSLPFRTPDLKDSLIPACEIGLKYTKKIGLLGASVTQHPEIENLLNYFINKNDPLLNIQIASIRADTVSEKLAKNLFKLGNKSLTMAIETGSDKLREVINKKASRDVILNSIQTIYNSGINNVKLYGMVGIPSETDEDINETIKLLKEIKFKNKTKKLSFGCSTFVPKAGTPFQWNGMDKDGEKKLKLLSKELHKIGIEFNSESFEWSKIQGLISRGNKSINKILYDAYRSGNTIGAFKKAMRENKNIDSNYFIFSNWDFNAQLPWENIEGHLKKDLLKEHGKIKL